VTCIPYFDVLLIEPDRPAFRKIVELFGEQVVLEDGSGLDRKKLGDIVFRDKDKLKALGSITGPAIFKELIKQLVWNFLRGTAVVVIDAPTLYETKSLLHICTKVIVIAASEQTQVDRIISRDGLSREQALDRIHSQLPVAEKVSKGGYVIWNDTSLAEFKDKVDTLVRSLSSEYKYSLSRLISAPGIAAVAFAVYFLRSAL